MIATRIISEVRECHLPRKLRTPVDVVPGNIIHAGETEIVRLLQWRLRSLHDSRAVVRQAVEHAAEAAKSAVTVKSPVMVKSPMVLMHTWPGREGRTRRRRACATHRSGIGKCLARAKHKRQHAKRGDKRFSIGHGSHRSVVTEQHSPNAKRCLSCPQRHT